MKHIDLFSGIGGFALATEMVWDDVEHIFCENDTFCQEILKKHWPTAPCIDDIKRFTLNTISREYRTERGSLRETEEVQGISGEALDSWGVSGTVDLLTGGFPCQPFSQAGRRRGTEDDRHLWPEMLRVIREFHPRWVIGENVGGLITWNDGMVFEQVCVDLESEDYEVQSFIIPAVSKNAPHRRDRIWIVAHSRCEHGESWRDEGMEVDTTIRTSCFIDLKRQNKNDWNQDWIEVATELCRMDDGVSKRLDRTPRLKALGNAIVPQVAEEIMRAIKLEQ